MIDDILKPGELLEVGKRLIMVRERLDLKQKQLAAELGLSSSYLSDIEKGKVNPGFNFLMRIYRKYKVSLDWLLFNEGDMFCGIGIKERGRLPEFDYGDQTERVIEMLDIMDKSPFFLSYMMSQYIKSYYEYENVISKDLEKHKSKE
jgi:transcriptional regulator with XRE-family HTH domain